MRRSLLVTMLLAACTAAVQLHPGGNFPADLAVFNYFSGPVVDRLADELVEGYHPGAEWNQGKATVSDHNYHGTFEAMRSVRGAVYHDHYKTDVDTYKIGFLAAVRLAGKHPDSVRWFYDQHADRVLNQVVAVAQRPFTDSEREWLNRPAYTRQQTAEMLELYAQMAEGALPYLRFAMNPPPPFVAPALDILNAPEPDYETQREALYALWETRRTVGEELQNKLREASGLPFDGGGYESWKFAQRRLKDGSPELLGVIIQITEDAARRARAKAAELRQR